MSMLLVALGAMYLDCVALLRDRLGTLASRLGSGRHGTPCIGKSHQLFLAQSTRGVSGALHCMAIELLHHLLEVVGIVDQRY